MVFAIWNRTIQDDKGNVQGGASVEVRDANTNALATLYSDRDGTALKANPFLTNDDGHASFFVIGSAYNVTAKKGAFQMTFRYEAVGTAAEYDFTSIVDGFSPGIYSDKAAVTSSIIPTTLNSIRLNGDVDVGDGLGGLYVDIDNGSMDTIVSGDGRTWYRVRDVSRARIKNQVVYTPQDYLNSAGTSFSIDATSAINAAISDANAAGGVVYVPAGSYGISGTGLLVLDGSRIDLSPKAILRRLTVGEIWRNWVAGGSYSGRTAFGNWVISGGVFDVQGAALGAGVTYSVANICQAENIVFDGCTFQDVYGGHCIDAGGVQDMTVVRCLFKKFTMQSGREFSEAIQLDIMSELGFPSGMDPSSYDGTPCDGVTVRDCVFDGFPTAVGSHGYGTGGFTDYYFTNISVLDCVCRNMTYECIRPQRWKTFNISGIKGSGSSGRAFIRVDSSTDFTISDFYWSGTTASQPIQVTVNSLALEPVSNWSIQNGLIEGSSSHGVLLYQVADGQIRNVRVNNVLGNGVVVDGCSDISLDNIDITNVGSGSAGVRIFNSCQRIRVKAPKVSGVYSVGLLIEGSGIDCVLDDFIIRDLVSSRYGVRIATSTRTIVRDGKIIGSGGVGVDVTSGASAGWVDGNDFRGLGGSTKIVVPGGVTLINTNNQV